MHCWARSGFGDIWGLQVAKDRVGSMLGPNWMPKLLIWHRRKVEEECMPTQLLGCTQCLGCLLGNVMA